MLPFKLKKNIEIQRPVKYKASRIKAQQKNVYKLLVSA